MKLKKNLKFVSIIIFIIVFLFSCELLLDNNQEENDEESYSSSSSYSSSVNDIDLVPSITFYDRTGDYVEYTGPGVMNLNGSVNQNVSSTLIFELICVTDDEIIDLTGDTILNFEISIGQIGIGYGLVGYIYLDPNHTMFPGTGKIKVINELIEGKTYKIRYKITDSNIVENTDNNFIDSSSFLY